MSIPNTRLLPLTAAVTFRPAQCGPHGEPSPSAWASQAEGLREHATLLASGLPVPLYATSVSVQILTRCASALLMGHFTFTWLGERQWQARTTFLNDQIEVAVVRRTGCSCPGTGQRWVPFLRYYWMRPWTGRPTKPSQPSSI